MVLNVVASFHREGSPGGTSGKEPACQCRRQRCGRNPWVGKIPWKSAWQPTLIFLPENPTDRRDWKAMAIGSQLVVDMTEVT